MTWKEKADSLKTPTDIKVAMGSVFASEHPEKLKIMKYLANRLSMKTLTHELYGMAEDESLSGGVKKEVLNVISNPFNVSYVDRDSVK